MHVKDMKKGVKTGDLSGKSDVSNDVTLGTGQMNWPATLQAARESWSAVLLIGGRVAHVAQQILKV